MSDETDSDTVCIVAVSYLRFHPGPAGRGKIKARGKKKKRVKNGVIFEKHKREVNGPQRQPFVSLFAVYSQLGVSGISLWNQTVLQ